MTRYLLVALLLLCSPARSAPASLAGEWRFALDRTDEGVSQRWFAAALPGADRIALPGNLQAQGHGNDIATDTPWVVALGDAWWKLQSAELREHFSKPGQVMVPFLSQPPKHYLGAAWYQREIEVPRAWRGRRVQLSLERPHWETTVWLGDKKIGSDRSLVAPHEYDLGVLPPGKHRLTVRIDNRQIVRDPDNDGHGVDAHAVSDALGQTWNGIAGAIELTSTTLVWIADAQVFPNVAERSALVKVQIGNATGKPGSGHLRAGTVSAPATWDVAGGRAEIEVALGADAKLWDEFQPHPHTLRIVLEGDGAEDRRDVTFGLREVTWRGKDLLVNGRVVNMRTTHFGLDFPLTGHPATDVESWRKIIRRCQEFGLNGIRFHSVCPPKAAFVAADELGFYLHPELGLWAPFNHGSPYTLFMEEETPKLLRAYGNHPSFVLFAPSNEPAGRYTEITPKWAAEWYKKDPRRLYSAGTGWNRPEQVYGGAQFATLVRFDGGELRNATGWFGNDFRHALRNVEIPVLAHEIGQWSTYPDFDVIPKFTGYMRPSNYTIFRHIAEQEGVLDQNRAFARASGLYQLACYKEELEANLRTPGLSGHQMLDIRDYLGQGTALIGVLDAFWDPKSYVTAKGFRRFHSATVPLARLKQRTFTTAETLAAEVELYHFGAAPLAAAKPYWRITGADGAIVAQGEWDARDVPIGKSHPLGQVTADLTKLTAPATYTLVVGLKGTEIENDWRFWVYPEATPEAAPADVLITRNWSEAEERLTAGGKVLFTPAEGDLDAAKSPPMKKVPVFWNIQMTVRPPRNPQPRFDAMLGLLVQDKHAALARFPTAEHCDFQWTPLVDDVRSVNLREAPRTLQPIVAAIDDWNRNWRLGVIFEANVGEGRLLVSAIDLSKPDAPVGARQLRRSLLDYAASDRFQPVATLSLDEVRKLWPGAAGRAPGQRQYDPDLDDGTIKR